MSNFIRAQFCVSHRLQTEDVLGWLKQLEALGCRYDTLADNDAYAPSNVPDLLALANVLSAPGYAATSLTWVVDGRKYLGYLSQIISQSSERTRFSFDIEEDVFLPGRTINYTPSNDATFDAYKRIVVENVKHLTPLLGVIDYEADLLCDSLVKYGSLASWGSYFSMTVLKRWSTDSLLQLRQVVDEYIEVDASGVLTFIHPLAANQAWTPRHEALDQLLRRNGLAGE